MDTLTAAERSERMARIRSKDTKPELRVRQLVHRLGYRFRLHQKDLPGRPDLVFASRRKVVFVHGCFWHAHEDCSVANRPKSRSEFWNAKFERNRFRDPKNQRLSLEEAMAGVCSPCGNARQQRTTRDLRRVLRASSGLPSINMGKKGASNGRS